MPKLSKESSEKISELSKEAETLVAQRRLKEAVKKYDRALKLVPEPVERYEATTWLVVAKGDALLAAGDVSGGADAFAYARYCFKGDNPYVLLKEGICLFELGEPSRALQSLARAYMSEGEKIFEGEDPKYIAFLSMHLKPQAGKKAIAKDIHLPDISSAEIERTLSELKVLLGKHALERLRSARPTAPLASLVVGYNHPEILDVPLFGYRTAKDRPAWLPRDYRHFADDDLQLGGPDVASLVGRLALASPDRRPKAREVCLDIARRLGASVAKVLDVAPSFVAYATDFDGRDLKENFKALGLDVDALGKSKAKPKARK